MRREAVCFSCRVRRASGEPHAKSALWPILRLDQAPLLVAQVRYLKIIEKSGYQARAAPPPAQTARLASPRLRHTATYQRSGHARTRALCMPRAHTNACSVRTPVPTCVRTYLRSASLVWYEQVHFRTLTFSTHAQLKRCWQQAWREPCLQLSLRRTLLVLVPGSMIRNA
eukprot:4318285-Pleurochrysis_carterae.AAC.1